MVHKNENNIMLTRHSVNISSGLLAAAYLIGSAAGAASLVSDDLITSSNVSSPWQTCGTDSVGLDVANLDAGGCAYRTTPADPGVTYSMTCGVKVVKYASITLAYLNADENIF